VRQKALEVREVIEGVGAAPPRIVAERDLDDGAVGREIGHHGAIGDRVTLEIMRVRSAGVAGAPAGNRRRGRGGLSVSHLLDGSGGCSRSASAEEGERQERKRGKNAKRTRHGGVSPNGYAMPRRLPGRARSSDRLGTKRRVRP